MTKEKVDLVDLDDVGGLPDVETEDLPLFDEKVSEWISRSGDESVCASMYIYKYDRSNKKELCGKFVSPDIPDEHDIGIQFGGGSYSIVLHIPAYGGKKRRTTSFSCHISDSYNRKEGSFQRQIGGTIPYPIHQPVQVSSNNEAVFNAFREGISMMAEMFKMNRPEPSPMLPDISGLLMNQYKNMADVMKSNLMENSTLMNTVLKERSRSVENVNDDYPEEDTLPTENPLLALLPTLLPLLTSFLQNPATSAAINTVARNPALIQHGINTLQNVNKDQKNKGVELAKKRNNVINKKVVKPLVKEEGKV